LPGRRVEHAAQHQPGAGDLRRPRCRRAVRHGRRRARRRRPHAPHASRTACPGTYDWPVASRSARRLMRRAKAAWLALAAVAALIAPAGVPRWLWAVSLDGPVLYGEGAVAHAAILARERLEYAAGASYGGTPPIFTAANYPPLFFHLAGLGDPFVTGRLLSIGATLAVGLAVAWSGRHGALVTT